MRDERDWDAALEKIAGGSSIRGCGLPKSTLLNRAHRDAKFERRLTAAQQTGRAHLRAGPHIAGGDQMTRDELIAIITQQARQGVGWACKVMLEVLDSEPSGSVIPERLLAVLDR